MSLRFHKYPSIKLQHAIYRSHLKRVFHKLSVGYLLGGVPSFSEKWSCGL